MKELKWSLTLTYGASLRPPALVASVDDEDRPRRTLRSLGAR
jgi:hypothetical protein